MMSNVNNNAYEVDPSPRKKRKRSNHCINAFMNPGLDILSTEDRMCNNIMEVAPAKRTRRSKSVDSHISFVNPNLECESNENFSNYQLRKELANVNRKLAAILEIRSPIYQNNSFNHITMEEKSMKHLRFDNIPEPQVNSTPVVRFGAVPKRRASFDLSFIEKIGVDDSTSGEALYLDDDLNESNIMEIKTIDNKKLIKSPVILKSTNPFLNCQIDYDAVEDNIPQVFTQDGTVANDFPFDIPVKNVEEDNITETSESSYNVSSEAEVQSITSLDPPVVPRRLFPEDVTDNSIQYMDESSAMNDLAKFGHSTLNEPINLTLAKESLRKDPVFVFGSEKINKQSKILGCDVSHMSQKEIFNCRSNAINSKSISIPNVNNNIQATFKDNSQRSDVKQKSKNTKNIFSKIKEVFKQDKKPVAKVDTVNANPYEVFRKAPVQEKCKKPLPVCFVNPALNLNTTDSEMEDTDSANFNTRNTFKITPMKKAKEFYEKENLYSIQCSGLSNGVDLSDIMQTESTIRKQVRFDTTLNHEKYITGNSFDSESHSDGSSNSNIHITQVLHHIDDQIEEYSNELDNCFNEKKIISQNL